MATGSVVLFMICIVLGECQFPSNGSLPSSQSMMNEVRCLRCHFIALFCQVSLNSRLLPGAVLGTIIYRISLVSVIYGGFGYFIQGHAKLFTSMTAALINLIVIMLLTKVFPRVPQWVE